MLNMSLSVSQLFEIPLLGVHCLHLYSISKNGLFGLLIPSFLSSLYILDISPLSDKELAKNILLFYRLPFCSINSALCLTEAFQFHEVPFY